MSATLTVKREGVIMELRRASFAITLDLADISDFLRSAQLGYLAPSRIASA